MYNIDFTIRDKKNYYILSIFKMYKQKTASFEKHTIERTNTAAHNEATWTVKRDCARVRLRTRHASDKSLTSYQSPKRQLLIAVA